MIERFARDDETGTSHPSNHPPKPDLGERIQSGCRSAGRVWLRYPVDRRARHEFQLAAGVGQCLEIVENQKRPSETGQSIA